MTFGEKLSSLRKQANLTQSDLADKLNVSKEIIDENFWIEVYEVEFIYTFVLTSFFKLRTRDWSTAEGVRGSFERSEELFTNGAL